MNQGPKKQRQKALPNAQSRQKITSQSAEKYRSDI